MSSCRKVARTAAPFVAAISFGSGEFGAAPDRSAGLQHLAQCAGGLNVHDGVDLTGDQRAIGGVPCTNGDERHIVCSQAGLLQQKDKFQLRSGSARRHTDLLASEVLHDRRVAVACVWRCQLVTDDDHKDVQHGDTGNRLHFRTLDHRQDLLVGPERGDIDIFREERLYAQRPRREHLHLAFDAVLVAVSFGYCDASQHIPDSGNILDPQSLAFALRERGRRRCAKNNQADNRAENIAFHLHPPRRFFCGAG